jgi:HD-GYP domain-containing protein (c-di-GMP phosphodiesterase class II)
MSERIDLPEEEEQELIKANGPRLIQRLGQVLRTARLHDLHNAALSGILASAVETTNAMTEQLGELLMMCEDQTVHLNDPRVRMSRSGTEHLSVVSKYLRGRGAGGMVLTGTTTEEDWRSALQALTDRPELTGEAAADDAHVLRLNEHLTDSGVKSIAFAPPWALKLAHVGAQAGEATSVEINTGREVYVYIRALRAIQALQRRVRNNAPHLGLARIVQQLIELEQDHPRYWQKLLLLKDAPEYPIRHPVHSTILAIALGSQLGLTRAPLVDLGMASLVADAGVALVPDESLAQADPTGEDLLLIRQHPADSARIALSNTRIDTGAIRRARVAWEHQRNFDGSGYPTPFRPGSQHLFTRIFAVAEAFDALTSHRPGHQGMYPEQALAAMLELRGTLLDPTLVLHFVNMTGRLPLNTPVELENGAIGRVFRPPVDPLLVSRPRVRLFYGPDRKKLEPPWDLDLQSQNLDSSYKHSIAKVLPRKLKPA